MATVSGRGEFVAGIGTGRGRIANAEPRIEIEARDVRAVGGDRDTSKETHRRISYPILPENANPFGNGDIQDS